MQDMVGWVAYPHPSFRGDAKHRTRNREIPGLVHAPSRNDAACHFANLYAPPFSIERWNAGRACMRVSHAARFG